MLVWIHLGSLVIHNSTDHGTLPEFFVTSCPDKWWRNIQRMCLLRQGRFPFPWKTKDSNMSRTRLCTTSYNRKIIRKLSHLKKEEKKNSNYNVREVICGLVLFTAYGEKSVSHYHLELFKHIENSEKNNTIKGVHTETWLPEKPLNTFSYVCHHVSFEYVRYIFFYYIFLNYQVYSPT